MDKFNFLIICFLRFPITFLFFILLSSPSTFARKLNEQQITIAYTYKFIEHIQWDNEDNFQEFHIGFIGSDMSFYTNMKDSFELEKRKLRDKQITVEHIEFQNFNPKSFQVIFISDTHVDYVSQIAMKTRQTDTLLISVNSKDKRDFMINIFSLSNNRLAFEFNRTNLVFESLKIDDIMLEFGGTELDAGEIYRDIENHLKKMKLELFVNENKLSELNLDLDNKLLELDTRKKEVDSLNFTIVNQQSWLNITIIILFFFVMLIFIILRINRARLKANESLEDALEKVEKISLTDQLTGAHNRRFLEKFFPIELKKIQREHHNKQNNMQKDFGLILIDSDHFKHINDTYGHEAGDKVLIQFVDIFNKTCRESDWVIRWGGEEFLVVGKFSNKDELQVLAERIRSNVENHVFDLGEGQTIKRTCSFGLVQFPFVKNNIDALSWEQTLNLADIALYAAKSNGRNAWFSLYEKEINEPEEFYQHIITGLQTPVDLGLISIETSITNGDYNLKGATS